MELKDLIVTPIILLLVYAIAYIVKPFVTDQINRKYFIPALTVRIFGALALGAIYQFYYQGGDTYNFHTYGSRYIWEAFWDSPEKGFKLLFSDGTDETGIYKYTSKMPFYRDRSSFAVIRIASFFDLLTFSSYAATAVCFAVLSFIGSWLFFLTFYHEKIQYHLLIAIATLFIPSVIFWGSGILKDTVTLTALGVSTFLIHRIFIERKIGLFRVLLLIITIYLIFSIKKYILLCYLPAVLLWVFSRNLNAIRSRVLRIILLPIVLMISIVSGYFAVIQVGEDDQRYNLATLGTTAKVTAYDIAFQTGRDAGSTYALGELDGSMSSMISLAPQAINVALFRPYLWEVKNPLMLISAIESMVLLFLSAYILIKCWRRLFSGLLNPDVIFCMVFSMTFAFAVGVSTFNFGTLSRYKIPLLPFYFLGLIFLYSWNNERKLAELETTE